MHPAIGKPVSMHILRHVQGTMFLSRKITSEKEGFVERQIRHAVYDQTSIVRDSLILCHPSMR